MKTYTNILNPIKQYMLIGIVVLVSLLGLSLTANAQSTLLGNDVDKINKAMVIQLTDYDYDIIIPKVSSEELNTLKEVTFNQMVYVADGVSGYYSFMGVEWEKHNVREVFEVIDMNLSFQTPNSESLIIVAGEKDSKAMLDYNHHIKSIYKDFSFDKREQELAVNIKKE